jgi:hypothetical protein
MCRLQAEKPVLAKLLQLVKKKESMDEPFELPVSYHDKEMLFTARLEQLGYTHRFVVDVYGTEVIFEPDEEKKYRAILEEAQLNKNITRELLQAIAATIEDILS